MAREERKYSDEFLKYQEFIISNPVYFGMPMPNNNKNNIPWVSTANSKLGKARKNWWDQKKTDLVSLGLLKQDAKISDVARLIHPTKIKPCQTCGKNLSIEYVYFIISKVECSRTTSILRRSNTSINITVESK